jgi:hypothetical protein
MALPRIEQEFGGEWLTVPIRIVAAGDTCEVTYGKTVRFSLSGVTRVMVSTRRGFLNPKDARTIHFLGHTGEVASLKTVCRPAHTQAAATFIRHLIQEWRQSERESILESKRVERERLLESNRLREKAQARGTPSPPPATERTVAAAAMRPTESKGGRGVPLSKAAMEEFERNLDRIRFSGRRDEETVREVRRSESQRQRGSPLVDRPIVELEHVPDRIKVVDRRHREDRAAGHLRPTDSKRQRPTPVDPEMLELDRDPNRIRVVDRRRRD